MKPVLACLSCLAVALLLAAPAVAATDPLAVKCAGLGVKGCTAASTVAAKRPVPDFVLDPEPAANETLADAIDMAWRSAPTVQQQRYRVRMAD